MTQPNMVVWAGHTSLLSPPQVHAHCTSKLCDKANSLFYRYLQPQNKGPVSEQKGGCAWVQCQCQWWQQEWGHWQWQLNKGASEWEGGHRYSTSNTSNGNCTRRAASKCSSANANNNSVDSSGSRSSSGPSPLPIYIPPPSSIPLFPHYALCSPPFSYY